MAVYLITYDLNNEIIRPKIVDAIKKYGTWAKLSESSYAVATDETPQTIHLKLKPLLDENDHFYVIQLREPHAGFGPQLVNDWLHNHLPR